MRSPPPRIGIIGGSGLGDALLATTAAGRNARSVSARTPFGKPSAPILLAEWNKIPIAFLARHGSGHTIPPSAIPFRANIHALKAVGCKWILASGAVGSLREKIAPRDLVVADQVIDKTTARISTFFDEPGAAVHVEMAEPFCEKLREILLHAAAAFPGPAQIHLRGTYVCMEGPAFSTRAESLMHRRWGGDLIGMTAMPEAKLAREAEISYALVALATDYDAWKPRAPGPTKQALLAEIIENMHAAAHNARALFEAAIPLLWQSRNAEFPAHRALQLALWTKKKDIPPAAKKRLQLLLSKYV